MNLSTPLGIINIFIDNVSVEYQIAKQALDKTCPELSGRYAIIVDSIPDGVEHVIACRINNYIKSDDDGIESGENLDCKGFYKNGCKLSIGIEADTGYIDHKRMSTYDYDSSYLDDGISYDILPTTKTRRYVFGIAWIENYTDKNEVQTWFGSDPFTFVIPTIET